EPQRAERLDGGQELVRERLRRVRRVPGADQLDVLDAAAGVEELEDEVPAAVRVAGGERHVRGRLVRRRVVDDVRERPLGDGQADVGAAGEGELVGAVEVVGGVQRPGLDDV